MLYMQIPPAGYTPGVHRWAQVLVFFSFFPPAYHSRRKLVDLCFSLPDTYFIFSPPRFISLGRVERRRTHDSPLMLYAKYIRI